MVIFTLTFWLSLLGRFLIVADPLKSADAILPLAGGLERVSHAAILYRDRYASWFILSDMALAPDTPTNYAIQAREEALRFGISNEAILLISGRVTTTYEEAINVRAMMQEKNWTSLIVVTSPSHTRRARLIFRNVLRGTGISVSIQPVRNHWYSADSWWKSEEGRRETWLEYLKLALYFVGIH